MKTEESRALVMSAWEAFASRDEAKIAEKFAEDAEWIAPTGNATARALDYTHHMKGRSAIARFIATDMRRLFVDVNLDFKGFFADGPHVVVEECMTAKLANGADYVLDYCFIFFCRDGRITQVREYMDTLGGERQMFAKGHPLD